MNKKKIWKQVITGLQSTLSKAEMETWFSATALHELNKDLAVIKVPNKFVSTWLSDNYTDQIQGSLTESLNYLPEIRFIYNGSKPHSDTNKQKSANTTKDGIYSLLNQSLTFKNFIAAPCNRFAFSSASNVADNPADAYNPLYLFSKQSSGKTHLMNAIGNQVVNKNPLASVIYTSLDKLSSEFSLASKNSNLSRFRKKYKKGDMFLVDDIHLIEGRKKIQKELTSIFNHYYEEKKQIVVAGKLPPGKIADVLPELRSRLEWGLLSELKVPDNKTIMKIIKKNARKEGLHIPDDVAFFLSNATDDLKTLNQYLVNLSAHSSLDDRDINISTVKSIIKNKRNYKINVQDIQKLTADHFNISLMDLLSNKKTLKFSYPRHVAMYLCRNLTGLSFKKIAKEFGNKDHSTVIYAVNRIKKDKDKNKSVVEDIDKLQSFFS